MKKTALAFASVACVAVLATGCGSSGGSDQSEPASGNESPSEESGPDAAEEHKAVKSHDALAPEDYSERLLSISEVPDSLSMNEEGQFGETLEGLSSDAGGIEANQSLTQCAMDQYATVVHEAPDTTAYRTFSESGQSGSIGIVTSLSKPTKNPHEVIDAIDSALDECVQIDPKVEAGSPIESADTFEPTGTKGEGICTTAFDGNSDHQDMTLVGTTCFVAWADEILAVSVEASKSGASYSVEQEAVDGVRDQLETDILPPALQKAGFAA